jgi:lipid-A-disaccharide synthase
MTTILFAAGDASGELHAAALVEELRRRRSCARFLGLGGDAMEKAGVELVVHQRELAIGGLVEVLRDAGRVIGAWRRLGRALDEARPDLVVLVDSPDFCIPFARRARRAGAPVLYYVSPQVWAWRRYRIRKIARRVDRMAVIFPFEPAVYAGTGLPVEFVGHPLVDRLPESEAGPEARRAARARLGVDPAARVVALLPGSRRNELRDSLPLQLETARLLAARDPSLRFLLALAPSLARGALDALLAAEPAGAGLPLEVVERATYDAVRAADVVLVKPGTATVEIALLGTPMVVAARAHPLTAAVARRVLRVPSLAMVNLIAGASVVPEFVQEAARPERIAAAVGELLDGPAGETQRRRLRELRARLGGGGAARRAADIAEEMLRGAARA